jgi:hypothetical protein
MEFSLRTKSQILLASLLLSVCPALAQNATATALVASGVDSYIKGDASAGMKAWLKGSALEGNTQAMSQANVLRQVEDFYGKPEGFELVAERTLSTHCKVLYFTINYIKGPLFCRFQLFEMKSGGWIATEVKFNTEATTVFPSTLTDPR